MPDTVQHRYCELRLEGERTLVGRAMVYGDTATMPWGEKERFEPGAFGNLSNKDIILNQQHDRSVPLARTGGGGLTVSDSPTMLEIRAELPETRQADDTITLVKNRVLRGLSIEFMPKTDRLENDIRVITRADLQGIAVVDRPAYKQSRVDAREEDTSMTPDELKQQVRELVEAEVKELRAEKGKDLDNEALVRAMSDSVETLVDKRMEAVNAELEQVREELRAAKKKMAEDEEEMERMGKHKREEMDAAAEERADPIVKVRSLLPEGYETRGKSTKDILIAAAGKEIEGAENRSEDYLMAKLEGIIERRAEAEQGRSNYTPNAVNPNAGRVFNYNRFLEGHRQQQRRAG